MLKKMREAAKQDGRTVLYVSHNMSTIRQLCDRCIVLSKGRVIFEGDVEEAIAIYSNAQKIELQNYYDLTNKPRHGAITDKFFMTSMELEDNYLDEKRPLHFKLAIKSKETNDAVVCRIVIKDVNGSVIGTTFTKPFTVVEGENTKSFSLDTTMVASGEYLCDISLLEYKDNSPIRCDAVAGAAAFTIGECEPLYDIKWNKQWNGHIRMPMMEERED